MLLFDDTSLRIYPKPLGIGLLMRLAQPVLHQTGGRKLFYGHDRLVGEAVPGMERSIRGFDSFPTYYYHW